MTVSYSNPLHKRSRDSALGRAGKKPWPVVHPCWAERVDEERWGALGMGGECDTGVEPWSRGGAPCWRRGPPPSQAPPRRATPCSASTALGGRRACPLPQGAPL